MNNLSFAGLASLACWAVLPVLVLGGCPEAPEQCRGCLPLLASSPDAGNDVGAVGSGGHGGESTDGTGGSAGAAGGAPGSGGTIVGQGGGGGGAGAGGGGPAGGMASTGGATAGTGGMGSTGGNPGSTGGAAVATGGNSVDPELVLRYKFDDGSGTTAVDAAIFGGTARSAKLTTIGTGATATFSTMKQVGSHAVSLTPAATAANANGAFITVPSLEALAPQAITIAVWVNLAVNDVAQTWERIFDFGSGTGTTPNFYLAARASDAPNTPIRFAITNSGHTATAEQRLDGPSPLTANTWHHIAVVLPAGLPYTGTLYIDGVAVATNGAMTLHAADIGATSNNWLGRSQFSDTKGTNPCFKGMLDDFRVYRRALSAPDIAALFAIR